MLMSIKKAKEVLKIESEAIASLGKRIGKDFEAAIALLLAGSGRVVVTGVGKSGIIGQKLSATFASTGTPSLFLHPTEALHGDLGRVSEGDILLALSKSGETEEIIRLLPLIRKIGAKVIALAGNRNSTLARKSDVFLDVGVKKEACPLGLTPTASTTAMLAMGDALAMVLLHKKGFRAEDFAFNHPGGSLGSKFCLKGRAGLGWKGK